MAEESEEMFVWGDDFDVILAILEEDEEKLKRKLKRQSKKLVKFLSPMASKSPSKQIRKP